MSRFAALASTVYRRRPKQSSAGRSTSPTFGHTQRRPLVVRLLPDCTPHGVLQRSLHTALARGPLPLDLMIDEVAGRLLRVDVRRGGWAVDLGLVGSSVHRLDAVHMIEALDGVLLRIEPVGDEAGVN